MVARTKHTARQRYALSPVARVVATSSAGLELPDDDALEAVPLSWPGVCLLHELAQEHTGLASEAYERVVTAFGDVPVEDALEPLMEALEARGWLVPVSDKPVESLVRAGQAGPASRSRVPAYDESESLAAELPLVLHVSFRGYEILDHEGRLRCCLSPEELVTLAGFYKPCPCGDVLDALLDQYGKEFLDESRFREIVSRLRASGLLYPGDAASSAREMEEKKWKMLARRMVALTETGDSYIANCLNAERERAERSGDKRVRVVPVMRQRALAPLALGMLMASARAYEGGRLQKHYHFLPDWEPRVMRLDHYAREGGVFLFSNYIWSHQENLKLSARVKQAGAGNLTIHGGPDSPKYQADVEAYFREYPHIDVVVHGEAEVTLCHLLEALADSFGDGPLDLSPLKHVPGLSFRDGDRVVRTAPRGQVMDLDTLPSPYLDGTFELYEKAPPASATLETNRGCPYGCTFCDWGSATASKVRKFSLERVYAELEWCARNEVNSIFLADANFGMFERDAQIAEKVAELKTRYGYPRVFTTNYAKNKVKYLRRIVSSLIEADILTEGLLSLQSMDSHTLEAIDRSNIKTEKYDELAREFRNAGLPLFVDIMMGLPGSTRASFADDLQQCIDREVAAKVFQTELLVNSPMNDPAYREKHRIKAVAAEKGWMNSRVAEETGLGRNVVVESATFSREDYDEMLDLRQAFRLFENFGILRQVGRFMRQAAGEREIDFIENMRRTVRAAPREWPHLAFVFRSMSWIMAPPVSWRLFIEDVHRFVLSHYDIADDSALHTVLAVQHALLPARDRVFPQKLSLSHDYAAWHHDMIEAKDHGARETWHEKIAPLINYPAADFEVSDPARVCTTALGFTNDDAPYNDWELMSPVARYTSRRHLEFAESA